MHEPPSNSNSSIAMLSSRNNMKSRIAIAIAALLAVAALAAFWMSSARTEVVGNLPPGDLREIHHVVIHELRDWELPKIEWDNIHHLGYVFQSLKRYSSLRILWI